LVGLAYDQAKNQNMIDFQKNELTLLLTKCSQMLTYVIDAPLPEPSSTIVLYYYSNDIPSVPKTYLQKLNNSSEANKFEENCGIFKNAILK
jgi:hypothetical protein